MSAPMKVVLRCRFCQRLIPRFLQARLFSTAEGTEELHGVVGLEIHAQIQSNSKLFSGSDTKYAGISNNHVSLFDAAFPGTLPVLNKSCVEAGVKTALALNCTVNRVSTFDRKHYFYADLPTGYQITQQRKALANGGHLKITVKPTSSKNPTVKRVNILQIQLEQDSGKSLHNEQESISLIDLNRADIGLMEIITAPDMSNGDEAAAFVKELKMILKIIGTCDGKMEEGSLRVDANISVHRPGEPFGTRVEIKNLNSTRSVAKGIDYEIDRQKKMVKQGIPIVNETKTFDTKTKETVPMRDKEIEQDYRFMPEPNLPPLHVYDNATVPEDLHPSQCVNIDTLREQIPDLPENLRQNLRDRYDLSLQTSTIIVNEEGLLDYFLEVLNCTDISPAKAAFFMVDTFMSFLKKRDLSVDDSCSVMEPKRLVEAIKMKMENTVSNKFCIMLVEEMYNNPSSSAEDIVDKYGWRQTKDVELVRDICRQILQENQNIVQKIKTSTNPRTQNKHSKELSKKAWERLGGAGNEQIVMNTMKKVLYRS